MGNESGYRNLYIAPEGTTGNPETNDDFEKAGGMLAGSDLGAERGQVDTADGLFRGAGAKISKTTELVDVARAYQVLKAFEGERAVVALERVNGDYHIHRRVRVNKVRYTGRVDWQGLRTMKLAYSGVASKPSGLLGENSSS